MSLDCYPLGERQIIGLREQPMALDVAYDDNLLLTVIDNCQTVVVYDLKRSKSQQLVGKFSLGSIGNQVVVIDQVNYCKTGDYIACVGHNNEGALSIYVVFNWRLDCTINNEQISIDKLQLDDSELVTPFGDGQERGDKLNGIDACQRTGNLAASYGDLVVIYQLADEEGVKQHFKHIVSVKLSLQSISRVTLVENYLSIMSADHVQVLKLELLTLQIQSDVLDVSNLNDITQQTNNGNGSSSGSSGGELAAAQRRHSSSPADAAGTGTGNSRRLTAAGESESPGAEAEVGSVMTSATTVSTSGGGDTVSLISTGTDFSATPLGSTSATPTTTPAESRADCLVNNDSDMSIITMNQQELQGLIDSEQHQVTCGARHEYSATNQADDCISWNLNTRKLVKLPTLMHNTSLDLSSYHICHPLELLGPASESIACRVVARLYSRDFSQNQLEPVVMLCKQFDLEREPVKSTHLQAIYLQASLNQNQRHRLIGGGRIDNTTSRSTTILKSSDYELLASVTCFVATLTNCFVYSLQACQSPSSSVSSPSSSSSCTSTGNNATSGKQAKVTRIQTITHPDLCLDLRPDLLNVHLLTPLGLQICSSGQCDANFRYDWSSSADLNLSFLASNRARVLTTSGYLIMISSSPPPPAEEPPRELCCCFVEYMAKPKLSELFARIVHTIQRCQSISIRSNLLTYLHASAQLELTCSSEIIGDQDDAIKTLRLIAVMLCKQLLQKKQTNVITNARIDKAIKHLLDISYCDLNELMARHMETRTKSSQTSNKTHEQSYNNSVDDHQEHVDDEKEDEEEQEAPLDCDYELLKIYLKHTKYNQSILDFLQANSSNLTTMSCILSYMFDNNPRLLIKCAQRLTTNRTQSWQAVDEQVVQMFVDKLKQLVEFDSTGINRATVLFTLAILYESTHDSQRSLEAMSQIKPSSHLAITMCSNHEIITQSMAQLVHQHQPEVYQLFLTHLAKRDTRASQEFARLIVSEQEVSKTGSDDDECEQNRTIGDRTIRKPEAVAQDEDDEEDIYEQRLRLVAELPSVELADLLLSSTQQPEAVAQTSNDKQLISNYLKASINLHEAQFILARLFENSR